MTFYGWFQRIYAKYPQTWLNFGNDENGTGYKSSWILRDLHKDTYLMWKTDTWHHICFSYSKPTSNVTLIKVRIIIKTLIVFRKLFPPTHTVRTKWYVNVFHKFFLLHNYLDLSCIRNSRV